jgi:hypothetical protein
LPLNFAGIPSCGGDEAVAHPGEEARSLNVGQNQASLDYKTPRQSYLGALSPN